MDPRRPDPLEVALGRGPRRANTAGALAFGPYSRHILAMAGMISGGIIKQFRGRF
jgi:hypothetical protein